VFESLSKTVKRISINNAPIADQPLSINVKTQGAEYPVIIDAGMIDALGSTLRKVHSLSQCRKVIVVTDMNVAPHYLKRTEESLRFAGFACSHVILPAGENTKSITQACALWKACMAKQLDRTCALVALGGGVMGDLTGFVASTYMRGIPVIQVPTTLLAMVDSSVGGKTAINIDSAKNMVGTFWQPAAIIVDTDTLETLPEREWHCGLGEIAKTAALANDDLFFNVCDHADELAERTFKDMRSIIEACIRFKASVVEADEREEKDVRVCLNLGHTFAHAFESVFGFGTYSHGVCVAEGMRFAAKLALHLGKASKEFVDAQLDMLDLLGIERINFFCITPDEILDAMHSDKKFRNGTLRLVILRDVGDYCIEHVSNETILEILEASLE